MKKIQHKILASFIVILLLLASLGGLSYINLHRSNASVESMISQDLDLLVASENFTQNISERISSIRAYLLYDRSTYRTHYLDLAESSGDLEKNLLSAGEHTNKRKDIQELLNQSNKWSKYIEETVIPTINKGEVKQAQEELQQAEIQAVYIMQQFKELSEENQTSIRNSGNSILKSAAKEEQLILIFVISSLVLGIIIAFFSSRSIVKPILLVVNRLERIGKGDLSEGSLKTRSKDELGTLVTSTNDMVDSLRMLITNVNQSSEHIAASAQELTASAEQTSKATEQIAASSEQMAISAETQLNSVNETAVMINRISDGIQQITTNSESVSSLASDASNSCNDGVGTVTEVVEQMHLIERTVKEASNVIEILGDRSNEIGNIVTLITDISDQTSLLALNAAIEAARAGDAGRGFAVVADEVRKLADQSANSAAQITNLVRSIQEETAIAVNSMTEGTEKTAEGLIKTNDLSNVFHKIEQAVQEVEEKVQEVTAATEQITVGSNQMVNGVNIVKDVAESNVQISQDNAASSEEQLAMMEEISSSAQSLTKLADEMSGMVKMFKI